MINDRIAKLESAPAVAVPQPAPEPVARAAAAPASLPNPHVMPPNPLAGAQLADTYRSALVLFGRGKFDDARRTFQQVFDQDPTGDLADIHRAPPGGHRVEPIRRTQRNLTSPVSHSKRGYGSRS